MSSTIPRGIDVLVRKAAVDADFRTLLLERRAEAAKEIDLELSPAEAMLLAAVPAEQLEAIIARTDVPPEHRRAFLGKAAAAMLAALGAMAAGVAQAGVIPPATRGISPDRPPAPPAPTGIRPDPPPGPQPIIDPKKASIEDRILDLLSRRYRIERKEIQREMEFVKDLKANATDLVGMRRQFEKEFEVILAPKEWSKVKTVGEAIQHVEQAARNKKVKPQPPQPQPRFGLPAAGGVRPDQPLPGSFGGVRP